VHRQFAALARELVESVPGAPELPDELYLAAVGATSEVVSAWVVEGRIEQLPVDDGSFDCVISNGVINLAPDKATVFAEAYRVLKAGGRLAVADIISEQQMKESIVCDADLWASCIGGAAQQDVYREAIEGAAIVRLR